jgi:hypothetical protein
MDSYEKNVFAAFTSSNNQKHIWSMLYNMENQNDFHVLTHEMQLLYFLLHVMHKLNALDRTGECVYVRVRTYLFIHFILGTVVQILVKVKYNL